MDDWEVRRPAWRRLEFAAVTAIAITLLCVIVGQTAEQVAFTSDAELAQGAKPAPKFNAIDYAATGSTKVVIGPCDTPKP